jgi:hypothetical protein
MFQFEVKKDHHPQWWFHVHVFNAALNTLKISFVSTGYITGRIKC